MHFGASVFGHIRLVEQWHVHCNEKDIDTLATTKAVHTGANAWKAPADNVGGLALHTCTASVLVNRRRGQTSRGSHFPSQLSCYHTRGPPDMPISLFVIRAEECNY